MEKRIDLAKSLFLFIFIVTSAFSIAQGKATKTLKFSEFKFANIGNATKSGTAKIEKNELEIKAGGKDIWDKHDEFAFEYKKIKGDFDLSVQIVGLTDAHPYTKAGIMARAELNDSSQHVYYQVFPDNRKRNKNNGGCEFQYRMEKGGYMKAIYPDLQTVGNSFDVNFPNTWIRLKRRGDVYTSFFSSDNKMWKQYSSFTLKLPVELYVGFAVTSHQADNYTTALFKSIQVVID